MTFELPPLSQAGTMRVISTGDLQSAMLMLRQAVPPEKSTMRSGPFSTSADCSMFHPGDDAAIGCRFALHVSWEPPLSTGQRTDAGFWPLEHYELPAEIGPIQPTTQDKGTENSEDVSIHALLHPVC